MSRYRPGQRDVLEQTMLAMVRGRSLGQREFEAEVADLQRRLDRVETPRMHPCEPRDECDPMERVSRLAYDQNLPGAEEEKPSEFAEARSAEYWRRGALRMTAFAISTLRRICYEEKYPKLEAYIARLAAGDSCLSMRQVAETYGLTVERISQRVEDVRLRFNLPKNQHNKSASAVESYRIAAAKRKDSAA